MTKHTYAKIAKEKLDNMELSLFGKLHTDTDSGWTDANLEDILSCNFCDFFACLPKHVEAVLNLLNGGKSEFCFIAPIVWHEDEDILSRGWEKGTWYMDPLAFSRIKQPEVKYKKYKEPLFQKTWEVVKYWEETEGKLYTKSSEGVYNEVQSNVDLVNNIDCLYVKIS